MPRRLLPRLHATKSREMCPCLTPSGNASSSLPFGRRPLSRLVSVCGYRRDRPSSSPTPHPLTPPSSSPSPTQHIQQRHTKAPASPSSSSSYPSTAQRRRRTEDTVRRTYGGLLSLLLLLLPPPPPPVPTQGRRRRNEQKEEEEEENREKAASSHFPAAALNPSSLIPHTPRRRGGAPRGLL